MSGVSTTESGGKSGSLTYTGRFGDNFSVKAMYGENNSSSFVRSPADALCSQVIINSSYNSVYAGMGRPPVSCHPGGTVINHEDKREVGRLDFEWALGDHLLRFGLDREVMTTDRASFYPGPSQMTYTVYSMTPGSALDNGATVPAGVNAVVMGRKRIDGGVFDTTANAWYVEDNWSVTPNLLLNLGLRVDAFNNKTAAGSSFIKIDDLVSPRFGFSWDMKGDGSTKLFGNLGRYYLPVTNNINYTFAGGLTDEYTYWALSGWSPATNPITGSSYMQPVLGAQIGPVDDDMNVSVGDLRQSVDRDLDAVYQDEAILGFQTMINQAWSWGVNATPAHAERDGRRPHQCVVRRPPRYPVPDREPRRQAHAVGHDGARMCAGRVGHHRYVEGRLHDLDDQSDRGLLGAEADLHGRGVPGRPRLGRQVGLQRLLPVVAVRGQPRGAGELGHQLRRHRHGPALGPPRQQPGLRSALQRSHPPDQAAGQLRAQ